ncbi:hypothetical protein ACH4T9_25325 [Micromonospora sp. NPDC020750]
MPEGRSREPACERRARLTPRGYATPPVTLRDESPATDRGTPAGVTERTP